MGGFKTKAYNTKKIDRKQYKEGQDDEKKNQSPMLLDPNHQSLEIGLLRAQTLQAGRSEMVGVAAP
jgi:hypothetical protein